MTAASTRADGIPVDALRWGASRQEGANPVDDRRWVAARPVDARQWAAWPRRAGSNLVDEPLVDDRQWAVPQLAAATQADGFPAGETKGDDCQSPGELATGLPPAAGYPAGCSPPEVDCLRQADAMATGWLPEGGCQPQVAMEGFQSLDVMAAWWHQA